MKVSILTFQFAHNYGALLQAYALKKYIECLGHIVNIAPYYPEWAQKEYAISPFAKGLSARKRVRLAIQYPRRKLLARAFHLFQEENLGLHKTFSTIKELEDYLNKFDCVIFGSDQIWNDRITGDTNAYYGGNITTTRISYAASLGSFSLTPKQEQKLNFFLPRFKAISVREYTTEEKLKELIDKPIKTVTDPVFMLNSKEWEALCKPIAVNSRFMFLYFLHQDQYLLDHAIQYANEHGLTIYEAHPTLARFNRGCKVLSYVGPQEFLWLIKNAECICTNSFHAVSFCVIFKKKVLHIPNPDSPERTVSLLSHFGIDVDCPAVSVPLYDLKKYDYSLLDNSIYNSKEFLKQAIEQ